MSQFYAQPQAPYNPPNLQFYPSTYPTQPVSGHSTPSQAQYGNNYASHASGAPSSYAPNGSGFGVGPGASTSFGHGGVSGRMGEQGGLRTGWLAAFGTEGYEGEPPLLEELGVNFGHIKIKTLTVLNPLARVDQHLMDDSDLAGPVLFFVLFGTFLLFSGKVHFGYIYGLALIGSLSLHTIFSLMSPPPLEQDGGGHPHDHHHQMGSSSSLASSLTYPRSASVLGYCLLPLVVVSLVGVVVPMDSAGGYVMSCLAIVWCTYSSSGMFCAVGRMRSMRGLVAYPLGLFYVGFGIMAIFSSRRAEGGAS
ncbi:hypothetical protein MMC07_005365 [Pseudocyphellaria aurata]|nr:hypothetical protein [Pseudocyphellaria aurata]